MRKNGLSRGKRFAAWAGLLAFIATALAVAGKHGVEYVAQRSAAELVETVRRQSPDPKVQAILLMRQLHSVHAARDAAGDEPLLWRLRPYLSHSLLPAFLRVEPGAIDTIFLSEGQCDGSARTLVYLLKRAGMSAWQFNIVLRHDGGHTVSLVEFSDKSRTILDPLFGIYPMRDGQLLDPETARLQMRAGVPRDLIWVRDLQSSNNAYYGLFGEALFGIQGAGLDIDSTVDLSSSDMIVLGAADDSENDVVNDGARMGLTVYWHYLGHRYDRGWRRRLTVLQPTTVTFGLIETVNPKFITTEKAPRVLGNELIYELDEGDTLIFDDGAARRDWLLLRSYQTVDYVRFERRP